jgi:hypothetical protein
VVFNDEDFSYWKNRTRNYLLSQGHAILEIVQEAYVIPGTLDHMTQGELRCPWVPSHPYPSGPMDQSGSQVSFFSHARGSSPSRVRLALLLALRQAIIEPPGHTASPCASYRYLKPQRRCRGQFLLQAISHR